MSRNANIFHNLKFSTVIFENIFRKLYTVLEDNKVFIFKDKSAFERKSLLRIFLANGSHVEIVQIDNFHEK